MLTEQRLAKLRAVADQRRFGITVVLEDIHDPHNAAAIIRTCDGLGIQDVSFIFQKEKRYNPRQVGKGSSSSANKWLDFNVYESTEACYSALKEKGYTLYATALSPTAQSLYDVNLSTGPLALVFGNEHAGLSNIAIEQADHVLMLPLVGMVQSLNVSVTAAIFLYECVRQQRLGDHHLESPSGYHESLYEVFKSRALPRASSKRAKIQV